MIQIASDLVKKIAEERNEILQIIPLVWEYQPYNAKLIPVMGPEEKYLGVWSMEKAPIFRNPWLEKHSRIMILKKESKSFRVSVKAIFI